MGLERLGKELELGVSGDGGWDFSFQLRVSLKHGKGDFPVVCLKTNSLLRTSRPARRFSFLCIAICRMKDLLMI